MAIFFSCKKVRQTNFQTTTLEGQFGTFWAKMNTNYVFWDIDTTDWDAVYKKYQPLFAQLGQSSDSLQKAARYYNEMTKGLIDGHFYMSFTQPSIVGQNPYPSFAKNSLSTSFHYPYPYSSVDSSYLDNGYSIVVDNNYSENGTPLIVLMGTIHQKTLFFSCNHFSLSKAYNSSSQIKPLIDRMFKMLHESSTPLKGVIIDVRSNQGGDLNDLNFLLGKFINRPLIFGYTQTKLGNGRLDYSPWVNAFIKPETGNIAIDLPIIILSDKVSASLSEIMVMGVHAMANGRCVGDTTWGATGAIVPEDVFNDGQFNVDNLCNVKTSSCRFKYNDGKIYEGKGFPPDVYIPFDLNLLRNGIDNQLEKAILLLL